MKGIDVHRRYVSFFYSNMKYSVHKILFDLKEAFIDPFGYVRRTSETRCPKVSCFQNLCRRAVFDSRVLSGCRLFYYTESVHFAMYEPRGQPRESDQNVLPTVVGWKKRRVLVVGQK